MPEKEGDCAKNKLGSGWIHINSQAMFCLQYLPDLLLHITDLLLIRRGQIF